MVEFDISAIKVLILNSLVALFHSKIPSTSTEVCKLSINTVNEVHIPNVCVSQLIVSQCSSLISQGMIGDFFFCLFLKTVLRC